VINVRSMHSIKEKKRYKYYMWT